MNHASLFDGISGFLLAAYWAGWNNKFLCEKDKWCLKVSKKNFPNVTQYEDIKQTDFTIWRGCIDVLSGGTPCQPFSQAGQRKGTEDDRHLWPEFMRAIREIQPRWVVAENVYGFVNWNEGMALEAAITDLEAEGYEAIPYVLPACATGAPHRRDRVWIVAYGKSNNEWRGRLFKKCEERKVGGHCSTMANTNSGQRNGKEYKIQARRDSIKFRCKNVPYLEQPGLERQNGLWESIRPYEGGSKHGQNRNETKSGMGRVVNGIPSGMDGRVIWDSEPDIPRTVKSMRNRVDRLKGLGNAIVPQVAYKIFETINDYETNHKNEKLQTP